MGNVTRRHPCKDSQESFLEPRGVTKVCIGVCQIVPNESTACTRFEPMG